MLDLFIKNASILDGTGNPAFHANVCVKDGKIVSITRKNCDAVTIINGTDKILCPGFIDSHSHSDILFFTDPECENKLRQGVTTEMCGQCGFTYAPVTKEGGPAVISYFNYLNAGMPKNYQEFSTFGKYMDIVEKQPLGPNIGLLLGHGIIRLNAMGLQNRIPNEKEINIMKSLTREAMESGAFGMSTGLRYAPGCFSNIKELGELCSIIGQFGGIYASHIRNQGKFLLESVEEAVKIGECGGVPVIISHHKATGRSNWGKVKKSIEYIHKANKSGHDVYHDVYPYLATSTTLNATLPPSILSIGLENLLKNLQDNEFKSNLHKQIFEPGEQWDNDLLETGYDGIMIVAAQATPDAVGKTIAEYAEFRHLDPFDAYIELLVKNKLAVMTICFSLCDDDVNQVISDEFSMIGSDGLYQKGIKMTHPRAIGTFPRVLGRYVREKGILTLPNAIRKMTSLTAQAYGIKGKGLIKEGADADLVLFDAKTIIDQSTFVSPFEPNIGIDYVIVNGKIAVDHDVCTGAGAGRLLRHCN